MDDDHSSPIVNNKNHLGLQLEQPTKYIEALRDVESGACPIDEDYDKGAEGDNEEEPDFEGELPPPADANADTVALQQDDSKIPPMYQVEPGCTALSCYASIITFIIMCIGIFWLLVHSLPANASVLEPEAADPVDRAELIAEQKLSLKLPVSTRQCPIPTGGSRG